MAAQASSLARLADGIGWTGARTELLHGILSAFETRAGTFRRGTLDGWRDDVGGLLMTPAWATVEDLASRWGYDDGPLFATPPAVDDVLTDLLERVHVEFAEESESRDQFSEKIQRLEHDVAVYQRMSADLRQEIAERDARIEDLQRRVLQLRSRAVMRVVDTVARSYRKLRLAR